jgi:periplasmic protein CpxP/Spy
MNPQSKNKILLIIIGVLLATNLVLVSFFIFNNEALKKPVRGNRKAMISTFLQKEIGFNQQQLQQYNVLYEQHRSKIKPMYDAARIEKENAFKKLGIDNFSDSSIFIAVATNTDKQKEIETTMFKYFKDIRMLCTPAQQPAFDSLFYKMLSRRNGDKKK